MIQRNNLTNRRKKVRIKIYNLNDFKEALKKEGYSINEPNEEKLKEEIAKAFKLDHRVIESLWTCFREAEIAYIADDILDLIDYIKKGLLFESECDKLCQEISTIRTLVIDRVEYEREPRIQENVESMLKKIETVEKETTGKISEEGRIKLEELEKEISNEYLYAKDIELLKKMVSYKNEGIKHGYNAQTKTKTLFIEIPEKINDNYIKAKKGSVEYHQHLNDNIPRIQRLIKNMHKYMKTDEKEKTTVRINQSEVLQDSINIAVAMYDGKEFKAISGSDEIANFCITPLPEEANFISSKVNRLSKLGIGYDRVNDSEKKILEEIHKQIEKNVLRNEGKLILYSKWKPCPSCYFVIYQFCEKHPKIKVEVKYIKPYGILKK